MALFNEKVGYTRRKYNAADKKEKEEMLMAKNVYGLGTYDTITRNGYTYVRYRKTYGNERKEFTGATKQEVDKKVREFEKNPLFRTQQQYLKMNFGDFIQECLVEFANEQRDLSLATNTNYLNSLKRIRERALGKLQLGRVGAKELTTYLLDLRDKPYAKATINKDYFLIKRCLERAKGKGILKENPADKVAPIKEKEVIKQTKKVVALDVDDMKKLFVEAKRVNTKEHQINGEIGTRVYGTNADVVCFLIYTGLRIGECLALKYSDLEESLTGNTLININCTLKRLPNEEGELVLQRGSTKTQSSKRRVVLCKEALEIINAQKKAHPNATKDDYIFVGETGNPIHYRNVNRTLRCMLERANCKNQNISVHSLRHTFASFLVSNDVNIFTVSKLLGHSSIRTTETVYAEMLEKSNANAVNIFSNIV